MEDYKVESFLMKQHLIICNSDVSPGLQPETLFYLFETTKKLVISVLIIYLNIVINLKTILHDNSLFHK